MPYQELLVMPEDATDTTALAVLKVWGPQARIAPQAMHVANGGVYEYDRGGEDSLTLLLSVHADLLQNSFLQATVTINGLAATYVATDFGGNMITIRRKMKQMVTPFPIVVELQIVGHHGGKFTFTLNVN